LEAWQKRAFASTGIPPWLKQHLSKTNPAQALSHVFSRQDRTEPRHPGMPGIMIRCYCSPGKVLISDEFWQPTTDSWQLLLQALGKQENKTVRLCRRPARSFTRAPTKKQFGRKIIMPTLCWRKAWGTPG